MIASDIIKRVREIQISTGRHVADVLAGQYESVFKGGGIEFEEVRPYLPGDEIRSIDWNVTARMGQPFVKRFIEERQLTLMLMADVSASQFFGSVNRAKRDAVAELCSLLAFSASWNDDKVGLTLFHGSIEKYIPPRKGQKHSLRVVREILAHDRLCSVDGRKNSPSSSRGFQQRQARPGGPFKSNTQSTSIAGAIEFLLKVNKRRTVCFVVSDFFDRDYLQALQSANRKHDVIAVMVSDPREWEIPNAGLVHLTDAESGHSIMVDSSSPTVRRQYHENAVQRVRKIETELRSAKIDFVSIDCSKPVIEPLARFFKMREQRRRR
ncbi:MAG: DUF58 domain-containing protein [Planctomycetota bacterium]|nr:DUF58 domain-containing protein [Planctomycetota bacterium]